MQIKHTKYRILLPISGTSPPRSGGCAAAAGACGFQDPDSQGDDPKVSLSFSPAREYNRAIMKQTSPLVFRTGAALVALSALGYATNPIFGKIAYQAGANAISVGTLRFVMAAIILWVILAARRQPRTIARVQQLRLSGLGGFGIVSVSLLFFTGLEQLGASLSIGLFYTYPAIVALVGLVRGERLNRPAYVGLGLTALGTWMVLEAGLTGLFAWQGVVLILSAAAAYAAYIVVGAGLARDLPPMAVSAHIATGAAVAYVAIFLATGQPAPTAQAVLAAGGLAVFATVLALVTFFAGLPAVGPTRASIISTLEPVFSSLLAVLLLGERLGPAQMAGVGLVVIGAVAVQSRTAPRAEPRRT